MVNISTLETVAPITAAVADMPSQFSQKSGNVATNALVQMTEIFWGNQLEYIFRDIVDHGKNLLAAIGMVSKSTALNLDPKKVKGNSTNTTEKDYLLWTKDVVCKLICFVFCTGINVYKQGTKMASATIVSASMVRDKGQRVWGWSLTSIPRKGCIFLLLRRSFCNIFFVIVIKCSMNL